MLRGLALSVAFVACVALAGCTKSNPAKHCTDGTCSDPAFPFCDVSGAIAGEPGACIAAACTADTFIECRGDVEVRCNPDGSNYNLVTCDRGCDVAAGGCRLCDPGETACTNGKVATCDASGSVTSSRDCPLGCFENEPRCREIDPSNDLAAYFDMVSSPPSLTLEAGVFDVDTGDVTDNGVAVAVPSFAVPATAGGVPMRVFVVNQLTVTQATTYANSSPAPALVILARGPISIVGRLAVTTGSGDALSVCNAGDGVMTADCVYSSSASGGGAFATNGAKGGDVVNGTQQVVFDGGLGGIANGNERLVPLRGGCPAGRHRFSGSYYGRVGGFGGGAVQLVSSVRIDIGGIVDASGAPGGGDNDDPDNNGTNTFYFLGGGAGGGILLEAPAVSLGTTANLDSSGGEGGGCVTVTSTCGAAGTGTSSSTSATPGGNATCNGVNPAVAGGGGGGLGRIRINTRDGAYTKASSAVEDGSLTAGTIETR